LGRSIKYEAPHEVDAILGLIHAPLLQIEFISACSKFQNVKNFSLFLLLLGRRPLGRPRRRWEDDIGNDLRDVGCEQGS
jgi:hypothetical protein